MAVKISLLYNYQFPATDSTLFMTSMKYNIFVFHIFAHKLLTIMLLDKGIVNI